MTRPQVLQKPSTKPTAAELSQIEDEFPLTRMQEGMLYHGIKDAADGVYHDILSIQLDCKFHEELLKEALAWLSERHEILRTSFDLHQVPPIQVVQKATEIPLDVYRYSPDADADVEIARWSSAERAQHFDVTSAPLLRVVAHLFTPKCFALSLSFHHAILDGWSLSVLVIELFSKYFQLLGGDAELPPPPVAKFRTVVDLEQQAIASPENREFWIDYLNGAPVSMIPRGNSQNGGGALHRIELDSEVFDGVSAMSRQLGVSEKAIYMAAFQRAWGFMTSEDDVVIGTVVNCRPEVRGADTMVGLFLNTVPVRVSTKKRTWEELIVSTFESEIEIQQFRRFPLSEILAVSGNEELFDVVFDYRHFHQFDEKGGPLLEHMVKDYFFEQTNFQIFFSISKDTVENKVTAKVCSLQVSEGQVKALLTAFKSAISEVVTTPSMLCDGTNLLTGAGIDLSVMGNASEVPTPEQDVTIVDIIHQAAEKHPNAVAIKAETTVTYQQMLARADVLAEAFERAGAGPGSWLGICMPRTTDFICTLLAVHQIGAAYLPLDPTYPEQRLSYMAEAADLIVVTAETVELASRLGPETLDVDRLETSAPRTRMSCPSGSLPTATDPAYLIFTSGSTGKPKGVVVSHEALANCLQAFKELLDLDPTDRVAAITPISFDISALEFFLPLITGATCCLLPTLQDGPSSVMLSLDAAAPTVIQSTPTVFSALHAFGWTNTSNARLLCGGETMSKALEKQLCALASDVLNVYGPTETTIWSTFHRVCDSSLPNVPIGGPIANTLIVIIDEFDQVVPMGTTGEILIGGAGLAIGYYEDPDQTHQKFIELTVDGNPTRLYRTGDQGRMTRFGEIEFLGRQDDQIKINGQRVEPIEIEEFLLAQPSISDAVVFTALHRDTLELIAAIMLKPNCSPDEHELREVMATHLPRVMVPSQIVYLDAFPRTLSGKTDRKKILEITRNQIADPPNTSIPRDVLEMSIQTIFSELGGTSERLIGVYEPLRSIGINSLAMLRASVRIEKKMDIEVPVTNLLTASTISEVADIIRGTALADQRPCIRLSQGRKGSAPCFLVHPLGGHAFAYLALAELLGDDVPLFAIRSPRLVAWDGQVPETIEEMAACYIDEILNIQEKGPYTIGGWCMGAVIAFEMARQLRERGLEIEELILFSAEVDRPVLPELASDPTAVFRYLLSDRIEEASTSDPPNDIDGLIELATEKGMFRADISGRKDAEKLLSVYQTHARALLDFVPGKLDLSSVVYCPADYVKHGFLEDMGWHKHFSIRPRTLVVSGEHETILQPPNVAEIARDLRPILNGRRAIWKEGIK